MMQQSPGKQNDRFVNEKFIIGQIRAGPGRYYGNILIEAIFESIY